MSDFGGLLAVLVLVAANGFFVAAEFSLVAVRRSRVVELVAAGRMNAKALERALASLDANLAATQLGITISSLALGWIGEPAIAHLIEPALAGSIGSLAGVSAYAIAVAISFFVITALHILESRHEQLLVGRGGIDELLGVVAKRTLLAQVLGGCELDVLAAVGRPLMVHESMPIFKVLEQFKQAPVRLAVVVDEYGGVEGIVTQSDLLEALAGDLPDQDGEQPDLVACDDGTFLIDGMAAAHDIFERLGVKPPAKIRFHTIAGFALAELGHLPEAGEWFIHESWRFQVVDMDGRRIDKLMVKREAPPVPTA